MSQPTPPHPTPPPHYQPGPPGYQPSPPGYAPPRKKRRWPWIVGGIVAFFVIIGIAAGGGDNSGPTGNGGPGAPAAEAGEVVYEVTGQGTGEAMSITYVTNAQFNQAQENGASLPWSKTVDLGNGLFNLASVVAQAGDGTTSITCKITKDGEVLVENTSTGQYALVTCSGS